MTKKNRLNKKKIYITTTLILFLLLVIYLFPINMKLTQHRFLDDEDALREDLMMQGKYKCCLEKPCGYCLEKEEGCDCLEDIMNGKHPCGECMGEILEGEGNKYLSKYFATAIADEVGEEHKPMLKEIISKKYNTPVEEQV